MNPEYEVVVVGRTVGGSYVVCNHLIVSVYFWLKYFLFRFDMTQFIAKARIALNANYILSSWVYLDDLDTSKNVLYVCPQILSN